ncbi:glycosyltransferase [Acidianus sulfidivorans JP7]|uniref:Dolichyl-phosphate mannose synthase n=1 Tax=Acidianus sulfidivorans JP7 TaxID=619593 RepID=A0A2U9IQM7_9CREN|nr:glycosyltransferase [Acidianus sulfidivorans]AWR98325.1 glycosyltransferase [Acidianus sulfidivorans JP7]
MLSIIIPAYNEEKRIANTLTKLKRLFPGSEILVIFEGTDQTPEIAKKFNVTVIENEKRIGKGASIKKGLEISKGDKIMLIDADFPTTPDDIEKLINESDKYDLIIPKRKIIGMPLKRRFLHKSFIALVKIFFPCLFKFSDFQSGIKIMKKDKVKNVIDDLIINDLLFDVNLIYLFKKRKFKIAEIEISYLHDETNSKISKKLIKIIILMFLSLVKLRVYFSPLKKTLETKTYLKIQNFILQKLR